MDTHDAMRAHRFIVADASVVDVVAAAYSFYSVCGKHWIARNWRTCTQKLESNNENLIVKPYSTHTHTRTSDTTENLSMTVEFVRAENA